ncbi:MAG TPA: ABC transporter ATP-binding protein [Spirochaetota bacterium]|nr:ABC transporter ATP-binding protein [Spirochaetota bacterium]
MNDLVIQVENLSKEYRVGTINHGMLYKDIQSLWARYRGKEDPNAIIKMQTSARHLDALGHFWALENISFDVVQGDTIGIIGRNGAGKSTLLKILSRVTSPTKGIIKLNGRIASLLEVGTGFHPELTGRENVYLNGSILGMKKNEIAKKFDEIVDFSEIEQFIDTPVKRYSSGMYVRLAFAVAAHLDPEILVVDEVLAVGDAEFQKKCIRKIENFGKSGITVLIVSHNMGTIRVLCNKCLLLEAGRVKIYDETIKVLAEYNNIEIKSTTVNILPAMRIRGNGLIMFKECSIMNMKNEPKNTFLIGEDIKFEIKLESKYSGKMSFWIIIFDIYGKPLISSHQRDHEVLDINHGDYTVVIQTQNIGLLTGDYYIAAGVFDDHMIFLEWIDNCQSFSVLPCFLNGSNFDGRWGVVNQRMTWSLEGRGK